jgi:geranylgeranyl diphosphate synthase, type II
VSEQNLQSFMSTYKPLIEQELEQSINQLQAPSILKEAMLYSLQAGGKRIRPILLLATIEACGKDPSIGLKVASAVEMLHTYSLIHDDLPSMDDDDLRRGKPTNHKVFGEAFAILAGDALLTYTFQHLADINELEPITRVQLISHLAKAAGPEGMVGGQVADLQGEQKQLTLQELEYIHLHKTGKLLAFSVIAGALIAGADENLLPKFEQFAFDIGIAFQIRDDILDIEGEAEKLGKPINSDVQKQKSTYPSLLTLDGANKKLIDHLHSAKHLLAELPIDQAILLEITELIGNRDH